MFVACGLNHTTAPISVREKIVISDCNAFIIAIKEQTCIKEVMVLSTCNRTEIYCETSEPQQILPWIAKHYHMSVAEIEPYFYQHHDYHALRHILRVASGLDSMMLGEPQIFGQLKQAYQQFLYAGGIHKNLRNILQYVFRVSKKIRNASGINNHPISIAFAAVQLINKLFINHKSLNVLIIGAGETSSLVGKYLQKQKKHNFMIASRTHEHAQELAENLSGIALSITNLADYLPKADVIITATSCPIPFITKQLVSNAIKIRNHAQMFFLDLAVPRDIEHEVKHIKNVHLYNIDDLHGKIDYGLQERRLAAICAENLIEEAIEEYKLQNRAKQANNIICNYRSHTQSVAEKELQRALKRLESGKCQFDVLTEFSERLIKKLTHTPTIGLKQAALDNREDLLQLAQYFFTENAT